MDFGGSSCGIKWQSRFAETSVAHSGDKNRKKNVQHEFCFRRYTYKHTRARTGSHGVVIGFQIEFVPVGFDRE